MYTFLLVKERKKEIQIDSQAAYHPPSKEKERQVLQSCLQRAKCREHMDAREQTSTWVPARGHPHGMMMMPKREIYRAHGMP